MNGNELSKIYAENIKRIRLLKGMSQEQLADLSKITPPYISEIENQRKIGSFETISAIANALEVEPYELFLPQGTVISHNEKRTKDLMKRLRSNFSELVDTMEEFLKD
ncbi:MAG: helix-turn-helix domain-containing protein [Treponema sp.]|jgi:transcriptional regulator with XRE-family HTH domain|nr:helix-turn-helix domain-containing protein [Treponema sp.]